MIPRPNLFQTPNTGNQSDQGTPTTPNATPNKETPLASTVDRRVIILTVAPADVNHPSQLQERLHHQAIMETTLTQAQQNNAQGMVNQMSMEEAQNIPNVVPSTS
jgi:hypothetical protein